MEFLSSGIDLRKALNDIVSSLQSQVDQHCNAIEADLHRQIKSLLAFDLDNQLIRRLEETNKTLREILKV